MIETFVLPIVQTVLGEYIKNRMTKRTPEMTREDVVAAIREEIAATRSVEDDLQALKVAVRELDMVVQGDKALEWRTGDTLGVHSPRLARRQPEKAAKAALRKLHESVERRRQDVLASPTSSDMQPAPRRDLEPTIPGIYRPTVVPDQGTLSPWRDRVLNLRQDTARLRRAREGEPS